MHRSTAALVATTGLVLALAGCGANSTGGSGSGGQAPSGGPAPGGASVGVILPETATSARYESFDRPLLEKALRAQGLTADIENAQGDVQKFSTLADGMINSGVKVLIIDPPNTDVGAAVERKAQSAGIPVVDYDRLSVGGSADYYVSFDNRQIGVLQGQGLVQGRGNKPGAGVIEIEGAATDNNATLYSQGQRSVLDPLYKSGALKLEGGQAVPGWDNQQAGVIFEQLLTANGGKADGVVVANDGMAGAVITVLRKTGLNGKVVVTGQDATPDGLQAVLRGDQYMTVDKPIDGEADAAAKLAGALAKGDRAAADALATQSTLDPKTGRQVKSVLLDPVMITKDKVKSVVDRGAVKASAICVTDTQVACTQLGIK
ncbi:MAG TPA: substrate-binding domain-containing protein [Pseudonocardia sp.]|jgi:D-xylose transport system substrate-binding protein|nr:substrate-binding domain-containing protein [Pseudonocardia sp.]